MANPFYSAACVLRETMVNHRCRAAEITIHLNRKVTAPTEVAYFIVE